MNPSTGENVWTDGSGPDLFAFETEKALGVRVPEGYLRDYGFSTLNKIIDGMATIE